MSDRRAYFKAYAAANRDKRREANRRWREKDRQAYNARQKTNNRRLRGLEEPQAVLPQPVNPSRLALLKARFSALRHESHPIV